MEMMKMEKRSTHPYAPYIPKNATKLIIGTIPPYRFCIQSLDPKDVNFYYGSKDNYFWTMISEITKTELDFENSERAINQRKNLLFKLNIGITDIIESCIHHNKRSDDNSLKDVKLKAIKELLSQYPKINTLIYTSEYVKKKINEIADKPYHDWSDKAQRKCTTIINGKKYNVIILYSPSPNALRRVKAETRLSQYKDVFRE